MEVFRFTVFAVLALVASVKGQQPFVSLTATNFVNYLYVDNVLTEPLHNYDNWQEIDHLPIDPYARLVSVRANNVIGGCSGLMVSIGDHPTGYEFVSNDQWRCSASPSNDWQYLGYDDSTWTPAFQVGRNGVTGGCPWIPLSEMPENAFWIWTPAHTAGDMVVSCRGYTPICDHSPCENGGTCNRNAPDLCTCPVRYGGRFCELQINECDSNPCQHGGLCELTDRGYVCHCGIGNTGTHCETDVTACASQPCQNGGSCIFDSTPDGYHCDCPQGFDGDDCENNIDECESSPCRNGATCTDIVNGVQCECAPGYTGLLCQNNINECASGPCQNAGTCNDLINGYDCDCNSGYQGPHCETGVGQCATNPCENGGTCTLDGPAGAVECICPPGWYGQFCASNADECVSSPCRNGGKCVDGEERFECECVPGYIGDLCEDVAPHCGDLMAMSDYAPSRNFWTLCEINIIDHPTLTEMPCTELIVGINHYNDSKTITAMGGTFGCYPTKFPDEMPNGACIDSYNQNVKLGTCLSCTHMGICIDVPPPK